MLSGWIKFQIGPNSQPRLFGKLQKMIQSTLNIFLITLHLKDQQGLFYFYYLCFRKYLLNIANTIFPNSVINAVIEARKKRENKEIEEAPIVLTGEFA